MNVPTVDWTGAIWMVGGIVLLMIVTFACDSYMCLLAEEKARRSQAELRRRWPELY